MAIKQGPIETRLNIKYWWVFWRAKEPIPNGITKITSAVATLRNKIEDLYAFSKGFCLFFIDLPNLNKIYTKNITYKGLWLEDKTVLYTIITLEITKNCKIPKISKKNIENEAKRLGKII